jgi:signal transduction histidine kinase
VLIQGADRIAGYISGLLLQDSERLEREKTGRQSAIYRAMLACEDTEPESALCRELLEQYRAEQIVFFVSRGKRLECLTSEPSPAVPPDEAVERVGRNLAPEFAFFDLDESQRFDRNLAASHGLLQRACIPLWINSLLGVIDIRWRKDIRRSEHVLRHGYEELLNLRVNLASLYQRYLIGAELKEATNKAEALETRAAYIADAMVAPAKQALHRCNNIDALLEGLENAVAAGRDQQQIISRIHELRSKARQLPRAMRFLKAGVEPSRFIEPVDSLVREAISEFNEDPEIKFVLALCPGLDVNVNRAWIVEAFFNIIDNGIRAMHDKGESGIFTISTTAVNGKARVVFKDTGIGTTREQIEMLLKGSDRPAKAYRTGVGGPLTRILLAEQGGDISIVSQKGFGTGPMAGRHDAKWAQKFGEH